MIQHGSWGVERLASSQQWRRVRILGRESGRLCFGPVTGVEDDIRSACRGKIYLSFTPSQLFLLNHGVQDMKPDLLDLQIQQEFIDQGLATEGIDYVHRKKQLAGNSGHNQYLSTFVPEPDLLELYTLAISWRRIRCLRIVPGAVALAGLFRQVTEDPVLALLLDPEKYQLLAVRNGAPLYNQKLSSDAAGGFDMGLLPHALDFAARILKRDYEITEYHFCCLGPQREHFDGAQFPELEPWAPDFSKVIRSEHPEDILSYPLVFGGVFADNVYDYTPVEFSRSWKLQRIAGIVASLSGLAAIGALSCWYLLQSDLGLLRTEYMKLSRTVADQRLELTTMMPTEDQFAVVDRLISIRTNAAGELRLDDLIRNISLSLAPEVQITALEVERQGKEKTGTVAPPPDTENLPGDGIPMPGENSRQGQKVTFPEELQASPLQVKLNCMTKGNHELAIKRIQQTVVALNTLFSLKAVRWRYDEEKKRGYLSCTLSAMERGGG